VAQLHHNVTNRSGRRGVINIALPSSVGFVVKLVA
jgi:hypothetical protein